MIPYLCHSVIMHLEKKKLFVFIFVRMKKREERVGNFPVLVTRHDILCQKSEYPFVNICLWSWTHSVKGLEKSQWALVGNWGQNGYRNVLGYFLLSRPLELKLSL